MCKVTACCVQVVTAVWEKITPGLLEHFDAPASLQLIAPRPLLIVNGEVGPLSAAIPGAREPEYSDTAAVQVDPRCPIEGVRAAVKQAEDATGVSIRLHAEPGVAHAITEPMWQEVDDFFAQHLLGRSSL